MYTDMYCTFDNDVPKYHYPYSFYLHNKPYLNMVQTASIKWNAGDTPKITFHVGQEDIGENININNCSFTINFYNFRKESIDLKFVYGPSNEDAQERCLIVSLDEKTSKKYFPQGIYYIDIILIDDLENVVYTVVPKDKCMVYVK